MGPSESCAQMLLPLRVPTDRDEGSTNLHKEQEEIRLMHLRNGETTPDSPTINT